MFKEVLPNLKHGSDGLIFTSSVAPYVTSTNSKMYGRIQLLMKSDRSSDMDMNAHI